MSWGSRPFYMGQGLSSPQPGDKIKPFGIHPASPAIPVSPRIPRIRWHQPQVGTPLPHAPGARMTWVKQIPSNYWTRWRMIQGTNIGRLIGSFYIISEDCLMMLILILEVWGPFHWIRIDVLCNSLPKIGRDLSWGPISGLCGILTA